MRQGGEAAIEIAGEFFMRNDPVHKSLYTIARRLNELGISYAVAGGMALVAHGYARTTVDIDILVSAESLRRIHNELEGLGYVAPFAGSRQLRDTATSVRIEFLIEGGFPGDGKPKSVAFPNPEQVAVEIDGIRYLQLDKLVELKLASGISAPHRLKDLADVQELIRVLSLPPEFADKLDPSVRPKYLELLEAIRSAGE